MARPDLSNETWIVFLPPLVSKRLAYPTRLDMFRLLVKAGQPGLPFGKIRELTGVPALTLSYHLATLTRAGLVTQTRQGRQNYSAAAFETMHALVEFLAAECCTLAEHDHRAPRDKSAPTFAEVEGA